MSEPDRSLPSPMQMLASGDTRRIVAEGARWEARLLRTEALREQAFSALWDRHGNGDADDHAIAWFWFRARVDVDASMEVLGARTTPEAVAELTEHGWERDGRSHPK